MATQTCDTIVKTFSDIGTDANALYKLASSIGKNQLATKERAAKHFCGKLLPKAQEVWGRQVRLTLHGSRAKNTFLDESDFDYHLDDTLEPVTLDEMHRLKELCKDIRGVNPLPKVKLALVIVCSFEGLEKPGVVIEIVPSRCDYVDEADLIESLIAKPSMYFVDCIVASNVVRLLKYFFQRTAPCLKGCAIENLVEAAHRHDSHCIYAGNEANTMYLFLRMLHIIAEQQAQSSQYAAMLAFIEKVYPEGVPTPDTGDQYVSDVSDDISDDVSSLFEGLSQDKYWRADNSDSLEHFMWADANLKLSTEDSSSVDDGSGVPSYLRLQRIGGGPHSAPWAGYEDVITEDNCHYFGINDYIFDKYGGMMGFTNWFGDDEVESDD